MEYFNIFTHIVLVMSLGWYLITNLQWYSYKIERVIFKHHKLNWHIIYFVMPFVMYYLLPSLYFLKYFYALYLPILILWNMKLDKTFGIKLQGVQRIFSHYFWFRNHFSTKSFFCFLKRKKIVKNFSGFILYPPIL